MIYVNPNGHVDLGDSAEKATARIEHAMASLTRILKENGMTLGRAAQAVLAADQLLSALSLIYDQLYESSAAAGVIGRRLEHPISTGPNGRVAEPTMSIEELDLSVRAYNCVKNAKIESVAQLIGYTRDELLRWKHFGKISLREVEGVLAQYGLKLKEPVDRRDSRPVDPL